MLDCIHSHPGSHLCRIYINASWPSACLYGSLSLLDIKMCFWTVIRKLRCPRAPVLALHHRLNVDCRENKAWPDLRNLGLPGDPRYFRPTFSFSDFLSVPSIYSTLTLISIIKPSQDSCHHQVLSKGLADPMSFPHFF